MTSNDSYEIKLNLKKFLNFTAFKVVIQRPSMARTPVRTAVCTRLEQARRQ